MSNSITWGGDDLSAYGLRLEDYSVPFLAPPTFVTHNAAQGDPQFTAVNTGAKTITLSCYVSAANETTLYTYMDAIMQRLHPALADKILTIDKIPDRRYVGRVSSVSPPSVKGFWGYTLQVTIMALPEAQDASETNSAQAIATDPDTLTFSSIAGNVNRIPAEFYMRNTTGAALTSTAITLTNDTTTESLVWTGTLNDDQWLRIGELDSEGRFTASIGLSDATGADPEAESYTSAISGYTSGDWPRLKGGVDNDITVAGVSTGTLEITYRGRHI